MAKYSDEELLDQIRSLADGDTPPTVQEFENCPKTAGSTTVQRRFGSWNEGVDAAGYPPKKQTHSRRELLALLKRAASTGKVEEIKETVDSYDFPVKKTYDRHFGGLTVAAIRGSISIDCSHREMAVPLTKRELHQLVEQIPQIDPFDQAVVIVSLLTGCDRTEHRCVSKEGIEDTETDSVILFPHKAKRGSRSVAIGPLYNQFVRSFDPLCVGRLKQSINFTDYPSVGHIAAGQLRRVSRAVDFEVNRPVVGFQESEYGPQVMHRDLRCTHYLFEYCQGASQAMLKRRLALSDNEIEHYHRYLDDDEGGWSVKIEWRD